MKRWEAGVCCPRGNVLVPPLDQGELAVLHGFVFLFMGVAGGGAWSIDSRIKRGKG